MKTIKIEKGESKVNRRLVTRFGEAVYSCPEVKSVRISVEFKDGSSIAFRRCEDEDIFDTKKILTLPISVWSSDFRGFRNVNS